MDDRLDLAAMLTRLARRLIDAEKPLLQAQALTMWEYVVLSHLAREPAGTQLALAHGIGYDKTRLIALLDRLETEGLITRTPDPADRRGRNIALTSAGERRRTAAQRDIRRMEDEVLAGLTGAERKTLLAALRRLAA
jgi:DNA-binding MarR family transcriptional regulator